LAHVGPGLKVEHAIEIEEERSASCVTQILLTFNSYLRAEAELIKVEVEE